MESGLPGVYVNTRAQMLLLLDHTHDSVRVMAPNDATGIATLATKHTLLSFKGVDGIFNGADAIKWNNGDTWHRVEMSVEQFRVLTRRPYVPLTLVAVKILKDFVLRGMLALFTLSVWNQ